MFDVVTGRRNFGRIFAGMAGVAALAGGGGAAYAAVKKSTEEEEKKFRTLPWPYTKLEPDRVAARAFEGYEKNRCMYGTFEAIVGLAAERLGGKYTSFPFELMSYGAEGIGGWGTVCGGLNGAAAAFQMLSSDPGPLVDALFTWHEQQPLPNVQLASAKYSLTQTVAGSPLCHVSIARWCASTGKQADSPERIERCGALVSSIARRATELLNAQAGGRPLPVMPASSAAECGTCHIEPGSVTNARTKMDCNSCHFHLVEDVHPETKT